MATRWISVAVLTSIDVEVSGGTELEACAAAQEVVEAKFPHCEETWVINVGEAKPASGHFASLRATAGSK